MAPPDAGTVVVVAGATDVVVLATVVVLVAAAPKVVVVACEAAVVVDRSRFGLALVGEASARSTTDTATPIATAITARARLIVALPRVVR
jgi:hypothetical protein